MILLAILVLILKSPLLLLKYLAKNKALLVVVIIGVALFVFSQRASQESPTTRTIPGYQAIAPPSQIAPRVISTASRVYYVAQWQETDQTFTALKWWDYNSKSWQEHTSPLPLSKSNIKIYDRG